MSWNLLESNWSWLCVLCAFQFQLHRFSFFFSSPVRSTGRAIAVTPASASASASALALALASASASALLKMLKFLVKVFYESISLEVVDGSS